MGRSGLILLVHTNTCLPFFLSSLSSLPLLLLRALEDPQKPGEKGGVEHNLNHQNTVTSAFLSEVKNTEGREGEHYEGGCELDQLRGKRKREKDRTKRRVGGGVSSRRPKRRAKAGVNYCGIRERHKTIRWKKLEIKSTLRVAALPALAASCRYFAPPPPLPSPAGL